MNSTRHALVSAVRATVAQIIAAQEAVDSSVGAELHEAKKALEAADRDHDIAVEALASYDAGDGRP